MDEENDKMTKKPLDGTTEIEPGTLMAATVLIVNHSQLKQKCVGNHDIPSCKFIIYGFMNQSCRVESYPSLVPVLSKYF